MKNHGGFEHNRHSLRIVEELEQKYPGFPGLNLTWEVREGLAKHDVCDGPPRSGAEIEPASPSLEAQVADLADEIAYYSHDLDDGLSSGLLSEERLRAEVRVWHQADRAVRQQYGNPPDECRRSFTIRCLIDEQVKDVVHTTEERIRESGVKSADEARLLPQSLVQYSSERQEMNLALRAYLYQNLYYNPEVHGPNQRAVEMLEQLFHHLMRHHEEMGEQVCKRSETIGWPRAICDYLSGMTDRYAIQEYERLIGQTR